MRIQLTDERRERLVKEIRGLFAEEFDRELSEFQATHLLDFLIRHLGPPVYNQAVQDVRKRLQTHLDDLDGEFYEPDPD